MTADQWLDIDHFIPGEFVCRCGCGAGMEEMSYGFMLKLDEARKVAGVPFVVSSGYRCPEYNATIGGASPESSHARGMGVDIVTPSSYDRFRILLGAIESSFRRLGIYHKKHIHLDLDPSKPQQVAWSGVN